MSPAERLALRRASSRSRVTSLHHWLEAQLPPIPQSGTLPEVIRYALPRWPRLSRFLDDGCIDLDTIPFERAIRPVALGRKNHLFAGSDRGACRWDTVATSKLNNIKPNAYIADVLQRMINGHPANRFDELIP